MIVKTKSAKSSIRSFLQSTTILHVGSRSVLRLTLPPSLIKRIPSHRCRSASSRLSQPRAKLSHEPTRWGDPTSIGYHPRFPPLQPSLQSRCRQHPRYPTYRLRHLHLQYLSRWSRLNRQCPAQVSRQTKPCTSVIHAASTDISEPNVAII